MKLYEELKEGFNDFQSKHPEPEIEQLQNCFDLYDDSFERGLLEESEFGKLCGEVHEQYPLQLNNHVLKRLDRRNPRPLSEFVVILKRNVAQEKMWINYFCDLHVKKYWPSYKGYELLDASGKFFICQDFRPADALIILEDRKEPLEIKTNKYDERKATFKPYNLETYLEQKANILVVNTTKDRTTPISFFLLKPEHIEKILAPDGCPLVWRREFKEKSYQIHFMEDEREIAKSVSRDFIGEQTPSASKFGIERHSCDKKEFLQWMSGSK